MSNADTARGAKSLAKQVAGAMGSYAHAVNQAKSYPDSQKMQSYVTQRAAQVVTLMEALKVEYEKLEIPIGTGFGPGFDPREQS